MAYYPKIKDIFQAKQVLNEVVATTPLIHTLNLSERYGAEILLKREDLQQVRSYKIRGAYNKIKTLPAAECARGVVCASAGNHAQGVAFSCNRMGIKGYIYMPATTPKQKCRQVKFFGKDHIEVVLTGDTFDEASATGLQFAADNNIPFIHPFDDPRVIEGQGTVGLEIIEAAPGPIDYVFVPIGGGGLAAGLGAYIKEVSPETKIIGVEPLGAASMKAAIEAGGAVALESVDTFCDGTAVRKVGQLTHEICSRVVDDIVTVPEGKVCTTILELYNLNAIVAEPAGALSIAALDSYADQIRGKRVVCIVSGNNNDISRTEEIRERSLLYEGLKHYFLIRFPQRSGALLDFVQRVLGPTDDITHFAYAKKTSREQGPAIVGIELAHKDDLEGLLERMAENGIVFEYLNNEPGLFQIFI
ncbi:MAG: threonine ammonia-lyase [Rikenellaceae bacterium]|jgi:threonine dehydratase|nr:threonine ammonia-lyase [Rikenellaceae bacterium]